MAPAPVLGSCPCWELPGVHMPHGDPVAMRFLSSPHGPRTLGSRQEAHGVHAELQSAFLTLPFLLAVQLGPVTLPL